MILFKNKVVKIPKFTSWLSFVLGVMENLHERYWWCADGVVCNPDKWYTRNSSTRYFAKIHWADRFGLCVIMERVQPLDHLDPADHSFQTIYKTLSEKLKGYEAVKDLKPDNVGMRRDGQVVMIDYGYFAGGRSMYLGRKVVEKHKPKRKR